MISPNRIERMAAAGEFDRLLSDVLRNGRTLPLAARLRLSDAEALPASALGLAVQRLLELTRRPTAAVCGVAGDLLARQDRSGSFGSIAATAIAVNSIVTLLNHAAFLPGAVSPEMQEKLEAAAELGLHSLFIAQDACYGVEPAGLVGDGLDSALVLWQLGHEPAFERAVRFADLQAAIADSEVAGDADVRAVLELAGAGRGVVRRSAAA